MRVVEVFIQRRPEEFQKAFHARQILPQLEIEVRLDWRCNAECKFCGVWKYSRDGMLSLERWKEIFSDLRSMGLAHVLFTGGEPTLVPWFFDLLEYVDELGIASAIITNGSRLDVERVARLGRLRHLREITVSIDSADPVIHDEVRKMRGLFMRASRGMLNVRQLAPDVRLTVNTVVSRSTIGSLQDILTLPVLPDRWQVFPVGLNLGWLESLSSVQENNWAEWAKEAQGEALSLEDFTSIRRTLAAVREQALAKGVDLEIERTEHSEPFRGTCFVPMGHFVVQPTGDVYPCCHVQDLPNRIGNLDRDGVRELLTGLRYQDALESLRPAKLRECGGCSRYRQFNESAASTLDATANARA